MKTLLIIVTMMTILATQVNAQVLTRFLSPDQKMDDIILFPVEKQIKYYMQPELDFNKVLEQDQKDGNTIPRFAVKVDQNYTVKDGTWSQNGEWMIWQIGFSANAASSLNFLIEDLHLPKAAEMYIISKDGRIIQGPVTPEVIFNHEYASDIIEGKDAMILVRVQANSYNQFSLHIHGVCQGIPKPLETRVWQEAEDCNIDINCPQGAGWENERDAVALVLKDGTGWCSGALVNNQCQDLRPYFLTAFHCLDSDNNDQLSGAEQNLNNYSFRFKYEAGTPQCPGNSTGTQGTWITYSGATFRAGNNPSDFALVELNGSIANQPNIALAGWDRNNILPNNTTIIHHPSGDSKKITIDNNQAQQFTEDGQFFWSLQTDLGATEGGTSGAPYFNQNHRIIGQHFGINDSQLEICDRKIKLGGRFDLSWTGGGTNNTRLSNWLGAVNPPSTLNTIRAPFITVVGNNLICTTNKQFTLSNPIPGRTISWNVSNPSLFASTGGAATSGSGSVAVLRGATSASSGPAILTFTMTFNGCNPVLITRNIWVGKPYPNIQVSLNNCSDLITVSDANYNSYGAAGVSYDLLLTKTCNGIYSEIEVNTLPKVIHTLLNTGCQVCLEAISATNACGTFFEDDIQCWTVPSCGGFANPTTEYENSLHDLTVFPNPVAESFTLRYPGIYEEEVGEVVIFNHQGRIVLKQQVKSGEMEVDMTICTPGVYYVQYLNGAHLFTKKIIKL